MYQLYNYIAEPVKKEEVVETEEDNPKDKL